MSKHQMCELHFWIESLMWHSTVLKSWMFVVFFFFFSSSSSFFLFIFFHWHYSPLWALACRTMSFHFFLSAANSLHLLTPSTWRSLSTSSFYLFLGLPLLLVPSSSWVKIFLGILSSSILSRWLNQLILWPLIHFNIFSPLLISSSLNFCMVYIISNGLGEYAIHFRRLLIDKTIYFVSCKE